MKVRGYIFSRAFMGERVPQHVQNIVIRDYCKKLNLTYLLSATEYAMPGSDFVFQQIISNLDEIDGIVLYSMFQLPENGNSRNKIYDTFLSKGKKMYFSVESIEAENSLDFERLEMIWKIKQVTEAWNTKK